MEKLYASQKSFLKRIIEKNKLSHAYLFIGPEGIGKKEIATWWAELINKEPLEEMRRQQSLIEVGVNEKGIISLDQIHEIKEKVKFSASGNYHQIIIINEAHKMNSYAQNALLKVLEEPRSKTVFILLSSEKGRLLETVLSRCQILYFGSISGSKIRKLFKNKIDKENLEKIVFLCEGRPEKARQLIKNPEQIKKDFQEIEDLALLLKSPLDKRFEWVKKITKKARGGEEDLNHHLYNFQNYFRWLLLNKSGLPEKVWPALEADYSWEEIINVLEKIQYIYSLINNTNINKKIAFDQLILII